MCSVFNLQLIEVLFGSNGCGIGFAQRGSEGAVLLCRKTNLLFQRLLCGFGIRQPLCIVVLAVVALLQLGIGSSQRLFILRNRILLKLKPALQRGKLGGKTCCTLFKALNASRGESELALRFLDLLVAGRC